MSYADMLRECPEYTEFVWEQQMNGYKVSKVSEHFKSCTDPELQSRVLAPFFLAARDAKDAQSHHTNWAVYRYLQNNNKGVENFIGWVSKTTRETFWNISMEQLADLIQKFYDEKHDFYVKKAREWHFI